VERHELMAASVASAARTSGLHADEVDRLGRAHALAMGPRLSALEDDHHPAYLHPGRTVLLLLQDVGPLPVELLSAAALHESENPSLRVGTQAIAAALGEEVAEQVASLPLPGDDRLLERLVTLDHGLLLVALAERLDQLRHAHLRADDAWWASIHEEAGAAWLPVAERTHPRLADRYRHWYRTFARRLRKTAG
jgi:(p)ppGpp synthase/HD superfamily hydrolase